MQHMHCPAVQQMRQTQLLLRLLLLPWGCPLLPQAFVLQLPLADASPRVQTAALQHQMPQWCGWVQAQGSRKALLTVRWWGPHNLVLCLVHVPEGMCSRWGRQVPWMLCHVEWARQVAAVHECLGGWLPRAPDAFLARRLQGVGGSL